jgi:Ethanolamine utilization protein EutJ (predicted chaperonin)
MDALVPSGSVHNHENSDDIVIVRRHEWSSSVVRGSWHRYHPTVGRTSAAPPRRAGGIREASSMAGLSSVVGLEEEVAADDLLNLDERAVVVSVVPSCTRTVVCRLGRVQAVASRTPGSG